MHLLKKKGFMYGYRAIQENGTSLKYRLFDRSPSNMLESVAYDLRKLPLSSRVLDLGCGDGVLEHLTGANRNCIFTSIDIEPEAIKGVNEIFAKQGHEGDLAAIGDATKLEGISYLLKSTYDVCVSWRMLHGIAPDQYEQVFRNINRALKSNGRLIISVACDRDWKRYALSSTYQPSGVNDCSGVMFREFGIYRSTPFPVHFFTKDELYELGERCSFSMKTYAYFQEPSGYSHLKDRPNTYLFADFIKR